MFDIAIVILYVAANFCLGFFVSRKTKSLQQWTMGSSSYNRWLICITLSASFIGGGFTIGLAEKTYIYGLIFIFAIWGFSIKEAFVAKFIAPRIKTFQGRAKTAGDIIEYSFGKSAKVITGFASLIICSGIIGAQLVSCGNILNLFFPDLSIIFCTIATAVLVLSYIIVGGFRSVIALDVMHFSIIMVMIPLTMVIGLMSVDTFEVSQLYSMPDSNGLTLTALPLAVLVISFFLGESLVPPYVQRLLIGKDEKETQMGTMYSAIMSLVFFAIIGIVGVIAYKLNPELPSYLALPYVIQTVMPVGLKGLSIAALVAIVLSSCNSFINSTSVAVYNDILKSIFKNIEDRGLFLVRVITFIIVAGATLFAITSQSALDILLESYKFWTPIVLVPLVMSIFEVRSSGRAFVISGLLSIMTMMLWDHIKPWSTGINGSLENVIVATLVNIISLFTINAFTCNTARVKNADI